MHMPSHVISQNQIAVVDIGEISPSPWTTTHLQVRQSRALLESLREYGQLIPLVCRVMPPSHGSLYEVLDGTKRLLAMKSLGFQYVRILLLTSVDDQLAGEIHLAINLVRGKPNASKLAKLLEVLTTMPGKSPLEAMKARLTSCLPLVYAVQTTIEKLRNKGAAPVKHNPNAAPSWVGFNFKVDPSAAKVCDSALTAVEKQTGCKRGVAFERICADFLAGSSPGLQP